MGPLESFSSYHNELGNGFSITDPNTWVDIPGIAVKFRSEERRVGKECRL